MFRFGTFIFCLILPTILMAQKDSAEIKKINFLNKQSWELRRSDSKQALEIANRAMVLSNHFGYTNGLAYSNKNLATIKWIKAEYKSALIYANNSLRIFKKAKNKLEVGNINNLVGLIYAETGQPLKAIHYYENSLSIFNNLTDKSYAAGTLGNLGIVYYRLGSFNDALDYYFNALKIHQKYNDDEAISDVYTNIGLIYFEQKKYSIAMDYHLKSLAMDLKINNLAGVVTSYSNLGICYFEMGILDSAFRYHSIAYQNSVRIGNKKIASHALNNLGELYFVRSNFKAADSCYCISLNTKIEVGDKHGQTLVLLNLSRLNYALKKYDFANDFATKSLALAKSISSLKYMQEANFELYKINESMGNSLGAFEYYKSYRQFRDSIEDQETNNKLLRIQLTHEAEKKEKQLILEKAERKVEENKKMFYAVIACLILVMALILLSRQRLKSRKTRILLEKEKDLVLMQQKVLQAELETSEKLLEQGKSELKAYTQLLIDKNSQLEELRQGMQNLDLSESELKEKDRINKMEQLANARIITEDDWAQFKRLFENVFAGFFVKLKELFPGITTAESRLAALLKLKLNTKEIASIIGVSADTVKKTRQRLRKKMNLEQDDDLDNQIEEI